LIDHRAQSDKFKVAARGLGCDEDPERFRERVANPVTQKPAEKPE
jgi:hypothetical protein